MTACRRRGRARQATERIVWWALAALLALLLTTFGCRRDESTPTVDPDDLVHAAADRLEQVDTLHFTLSHDSGGTTILQNMLLTHAEGDVARPGSMQTQLTVQAMGATLQLQFVSIGDQSWISNPFDPTRWQPLPGVTAGDVLNLEALPAALRQVAGAQLVGREEIDGTPVFHLRGSLSSDALVAVVPEGAEPGREVTVDLWIGQQDSLLYRVVVGGAITAGEPESMTRTLELSRFDQPLTITPPQ